MARLKPFRVVQIDLEICKKIDRIIEQNRYRGSFTSFIESIVENYADGLLKDVEVPVVRATRVREVGGHEQRKAG